VVLRTLTGRVAGRFSPIDLDARISRLPSGAYFMASGRGNNDQIQRIIIRDMRVH
jgi:hypothetical protein